MHKILILLLCAILLPVIVFTVVGCCVRDDWYRYMNFLLLFIITYGLLSLVAFQTRDRHHLSFLFKKILITIFFYIQFVIYDNDVIGRRLFHPFLHLKSTLLLQFADNFAFAIYWLLCITFLAHWLLRLPFLYFLKKAFFLIVASFFIGFFRQPYTYYDFVLFSTLYFGILYEIDPQKNAFLRWVRRKRSMKGIFNTAFLS